MTDVRTATAAIASAAQTGSLPVAKPTTARTSQAAAAITATRLEIRDGPPEPAAATTMAANGPSRVALKSGSAARSPAPPTRPAAAYRTKPQAGGAPVDSNRCRHHAPRTC